jgi:hypothetical protein
MVEWSVLRIKTKIVDICMWSVNDAPPKSLGDPKVGPKMKQQKKKRVGACSLIRSTLGVGGHARALVWD